MDAKDIQHVMKLCRKYGVLVFNSPNLSLKFGDLPKDKDEAASDTDDIPSPDELTPEQMMFFSAGGVQPP